MSETRLLAPLNDAQREAVTSPAQPVLVLAGAGSGKTRVLVHRIAWLIEDQGISPMAILAVTFTNKAAAEMRGRIEELLGRPAGGMWVGTFHGLAHRLLRTHWREAGLPQAFQILDSDDQLRLVRRVLSALDLDEDQWPPQQARAFINARKDEGLRARHLEDMGDPYRRQMTRVYQAYDEACERSGLVDFAELLLRAHELWRNDSAILGHYQRRFVQVLVDEFQDTNAIQYGWLRLLAGEQGTPFIVGDDDQSIYGWRGAKIENLHRFREHYPSHRLVRLEQNYRSTGTILSAANALIANNADRLGKNLWTQGSKGEPINLYAAFNEQDETRFVVERIRRWIAAGNSPADVGILYRSNAQSRLFEEHLIAAAIPYRVYGGVRFFERAEVKDALAYLRLMFNRHDDSSFERVVNTPTRGIGARTLDLVRERARADNSSLWQAARALINGLELTARSANALEGFLQLIDRAAASMGELTLAERMEITIAESGLVEHFRQKEGGERGEARVENLQELVNAARQFAGGPELESEFAPESEPDLDPTQEFLAHAALEAGEAQGGAYEACVQLMTLHSAKGLEFPLVFLCGVEEGLFPHQRSVEEPGRLEEERRLCYVGMTRAMRQLYITYAESRRLYGRENYPAPSRFIREIPDEFLQEVRARITARPVVSARRPTPARPTRPRIREEAPVGGLRLGQRVMHRKFGEGVVLDHEGQGGAARVQVNFDRGGSKWLVLAYANLQSLQ